MQMDIYETFLPRELSPDRISGLPPCNPGLWGQRLVGDLFPLLGHGFWYNPRLSPLSHTWPWLGDSSGPPPAVRKEGHVWPLVLQLHTCPDWAPQAGPQPPAGSVPLTSSATYCLSWEGPGLGTGA